MLEIYKEIINDLLMPEKLDLKIKESPIKGIYVEVILLIYYKIYNKYI
jgi:hypothetical protein